MKSILTGYTEYCLFCGRPTTATHHLLFGRGIRPLADKDGLTIPICDGCHNMGDKLERIHDNPMAEKMSKIIGQLAYEKYMVAEGLNEKQARENFRHRYGHSYL